MRPQRRQPTRLPCPWDSPGKNTGVGCHFLLPCMKGKSGSEVAQSCPTLSDPMDCSLPGSSVHGIFQARILEWGAIAFSDNDIMSKEKQGLWPEINYLGRMHGKGMQIHWTWVNWMLSYCFFSLLLLTSLLSSASLCHLSTIATLINIIVFITHMALPTSCSCSSLLCHLHHLYHNQHHLNPQHCSVVFLLRPILYLNCCISPMKFRMELNSPPGSRRWHWFQQINKLNVAQMTAIICYCIYSLRMDSW